MNIRNEIKAYIIRTGWSSSVSNLSAKLQRESLRYKEAIQIADVLGYDIVWVKRRDD